MLEGHNRDTIATVAIALSLAKKIEVSAGTNKASFNRGSKENKCYNSLPTTAASRVHSKIQPIYYGSG